MTRIRYPIGKCIIDPDITPAKRATWISDIANLPANLHNAVAGLSDEQLAHAYRPGGWTLRQVVHHLADEHLNAFAY